ncbi:MAG: orotidine-5'-phosphate decarboxylase [Thermoplasmata archaeon]|nr:orotidine-5'-phosphate decarboxylase [Candidatus Sysuiplasma acidicola]MBX8645621.1 orotidine-5'-phosphate decarboxylase [Candidatus Sysuiplasma acidicola]
MSKIKFERGLILALDETDYRKAMNIVNQVGKYVDAIKLNWPIVLSNGPQIITEISNHFRVICDFKVSDVPHTNSMVASAAAKLGASGIIVHGFPGEDAVEACINSAHGASIFLVVEMSNPGSAEFGKKYSDELARMAVKLKVDGIVAPATRPERIKHFRGIVGNLPIIAPGVGAQGGDARKAIMNGADALIAGRSIYESSEPLEVVNNFLSEVQSGRDEIGQ